MNLRIKSYIYLLLPLLIGSFTPTLFLLAKNMDLIELFLLSSLLSVPLGLCLVLGTNRLQELKSIFRDRKKLFYIILASLLIYTTYEYGIAYAEKFISASLAIVIFRTNPLLMLAFLPIILRERLSARQVAALSLAFVGILIGFSGGDLGSVFGNSNTSIVFFAFLLALGYALGNVIIKWQLFNTETLMAVSGMALSVFFALAFVASGESFTTPSPLELTIAIYLAFTNVFVTYLFFRAFKVLKTTLVTNVFSISPFFSIIWASLAFGEQIKTYYFIIAALVVFGIVIQRSDMLGGSYVTKDGIKRRNFVLFDVTGIFVDSGEATIQTAIKGGDRVLALKLKNKHSGSLSKLVKQGNHVNVFTDKDASLKEQASLIRDVLGAGKDEIAVVKVDTVNACEEFFIELSEHVGGIDDSVPFAVPDEQK